MIKVHLNNIKQKDNGIILSGTLYLSPSKTLPQWISTRQIDFALSGTTNKSFIDDVKSFIIITTKKDDRKVYDYLLKYKLNYLMSRIKLSYNKVSAS